MGRRSSPRALSSLGGMMKAAGDDVFLYICTARRRDGSNVDVRGIVGRMVRVSVV